MNNNPHCALRNLALDLYEIAFFWGLEYVSKHTWCKKFARENTLPGAAERRWDRLKARIRASEEFKDLVEFVNVGVTQNGTDVALRLKREAPAKINQVLEAIKVNYKEDDE